MSDDTLGDDEFYDCDNDDLPPNTDFVDALPDILGDSGDLGDLTRHDDVIPIVEKDPSLLDREDAVTASTSSAWVIDEDHMEELEKDISDETIQERKQEAAALKDQGNQRYQAQNYNEALTFYTDALRRCPLECKNDRAILYSNRSASFHKMDMTSESLSDCSRAIALKPDYVKALLRRATLYTEKEDNLHLAIKDYEEVLKLDEKNYFAKAEIMKLTPIVRERDERMKEEMMGKLKDLGNMFLRPFGMSTDNFKMEQQPGGGYSVKMQ